MCEHVSSCLACGPSHQPFDPSFTHFTGLQAPSSPPISSHLRPALSFVYSRNIRTNSSSQSLLCKHIFHHPTSITHTSASCGGYWIAAGWGLDQQAESRMTGWQDLLQHQSSRCVEFSCVNLTNVILYIKVPPTTTTTNNNNNERKKHFSPSLFLCILVFKLNVIILRYELFQHWCCRANICWNNTITP